MPVMVSRTTFPEIVGREAFTTVSMPSTALQPQVVEGRGVGTRDQMPISIVPSWIVAWCTSDTVLP